MSKIIKLSSLILLVLTLSSVGLAQSQAGSGQIAGQVTDSNGAAVPNATVKVTNKGTGLERSVTTSGDGLYTIVLLPPGIYTVVTESSGFAAATIDDVVVNVGRVADVDVTLGASGVQASVLVTADAIQVTRNESDAVLNETAITNLPINGRRFQDFVTLTPTAQVDPQRGQISLSGQRGINSNINVDGVDYNQPFFGGIRGGERSNLAFTIPQEAIKEFQVVASGYSAEFGRSSGGIVNAVTKSGDNSVRGSAFYLIRPKRLARGNEYTQALQDQRLTAAGLEATIAPTQHQFGGSIGGPIIKEKLFYFGAYEQQRFRAPRQVLFGVPNTFPGSIVLTPGQLAVLNFGAALQVPYTQTNDAKAGLARIDWNPNDHHRFNVRFSASTNEAINAVSRGETSLDPTTTQSLSTNGTEKNNTKIFVAQLVSNFGASVVNELRGQFAKEERPRISNSEIPQVLTSFATIGATAFLPTTQSDKRYQIADALTYIAGSHNIKFGGEFSRISATQVFGFNQFGAYNLSLGSSNTNISDTLLRLANVPASLTGNQTILGRFDDNRANYRRQIGNLQASFNIQELAFFAQDSFRLTPRLTINYGLRVEQQYNPEPEANNTQILNVVRNTIFPIRNHGYDGTQIPDSGWQWGPRLGFAYDPKGDGKTVIRGFTGQYFARTPGLVFAGSVNNYRTPPGDVSTQLPFTGFSQATFDAFLGTPAGSQYLAITGCNTAAAAGSVARNLCVPNTVYRQFAIIGINLNSSPLDNLPSISPTQISSIASGLGLNPNPFVGATVTGHAEDFKNPESFQYGFAVEHEIARNLVVGLDFAHVKTIHLQRNRDLNLPNPLSGADYVSYLQASNTAANFAAMVSNGITNQILASGRRYIAVVTPGGFVVPATGATFNIPSAWVMTRQRPTQVQQGFALGPVQVRESTAKSRYNELTFRARFIRKWGQLNAFYTLSKSLSDDDNERDSGGVAFADPYDLSREYYAARLDRTHQFVANPIFFLPHGFEVASAIRLRSGTPLNSTVGADLNGDGVNNDRPILVPGLTLQRNYFRNRSLYDVDMRVQKGFNFGETRRLTFSAEFFNILNRPNIQFPNPNTANSSGISAQYCAVASQVCGLNGIQNSVFLQVRDSAGNILINNTNPGSQVFQMQLGVRFQF